MEQTKGAKDVRVEIGARRRGGRFAGAGARRMHQRRRVPAGGTGARRRGEIRARWLETNRIALIDVSGFIASESGFWTLLGGTSVADVQQKLQLAAADSHVRAIVLRINSPGGEASASDMIYQEVLRFKETSRQAGRRRAHGHRGLRRLLHRAFGRPHRGLADHASPVRSASSWTSSTSRSCTASSGLEPVVIKSGEKKDIGSPTRPMTPEEREILQGLNRALFDQFLAKVRERRPGMDEQQLKIVADGRVVSAQEALQLNLVDRVGYLRDAIQTACGLAKIESADVVLYRSTPSYNSNIYAQAGTGLLLEEGLDMLLLRRGPTFLYLWMPGS